jgi:hypothetical protein
MSTVNHQTSTQFDDHSGPELSGRLTPSTGTSHSPKLPVEDFEKGPPVENENAQTVCSEG